VHHIKVSKGESKEVKLNSEEADARQTALEILCDIKTSSLILQLLLTSVVAFMLTRGLGSSMVGVVHTLWRVAGCDTEGDPRWGSPNA
jgi:homoserine kinase